MPRSARTHTGERNRQLGRIHAGANMVRSKAFPHLVRFEDSP